jgi:hypothetical protein
LLRYSLLISSSEILYSLSSKNGSLIASIEPQRSALIDVSISPN